MMFLLRLFFVVVVTEKPNIFSSILESLQLLFYVLELDMKNLLMFWASVIIQVYCVRYHDNRVQFLYIDVRIQGILINSINCKRVGSKYGSFVIQFYFWAVIWHVFQVFNHSQFIKLKILKQDMIEQKLQRHFNFWVQLACNSVIFSCTHTKWVSYVIQEHWWLSSENHKVSGELRLLSVNCWNGLFPVVICNHKYWSEQCLTGN